MIRMVLLIKGGWHTEQADAMAQKAATFVKNTLKDEVHWQVIGFPVTVSPEETSDLPTFQMLTFINNDAIAADVEVNMQDKVLKLMAEMAFTLQTVQHLVVRERSAWKPQKGERHPRG